MCIFVFLFVKTTQEVPKALLPVANRPVLSYVLELLEQSNLKDLIVVSFFLSADPNFSLFIWTRTFFVAEF